MADTKISALTTDSAPHRTNDFVPTYDASAVATKKVALRDLGSLMLLAGLANLSPADATTYYFGHPTMAGFYTTLGGHYLIAHRAGIITRATIYTLNTGTAGTSETSTMALLVNDASATTLSALITTNTSSIKTVTGLTISLAATDVMEVRWIAPTYATNPTGVYFAVQLFLE